MTRLLLLFLMLGPACLVTGLSRQKRTDDVLAPACITTVLILYFFYLFDQLLLGFYVTIGFLLVCWGVGLWLHLRRLPQKTWQGFFTPGMVIFTVALVLIWLVTRRSQVGLWDELRLWAGVPRALFLTDKLQLGSDCFTYPMMQSYYPGIVLFQYFAQKLGSAFSENGLFFTYAFLGLSLMIPCCRELRWKQWLWIPVIAFALVLLPTAFANGMGDMNVYYYSIYIDALLGIAFSYSLFACWQLSRQQTVWDGICYILSLCLLILLKDSGLLLAILSLVICFFMLRIKIRKKLGFLLLAVMATAIVAVCWKLLLSQYDVHNHIGFYDSPLRILTEFTLSDQQMDTVRTFIYPNLLGQNLTSTRYNDFWLSFPVRRSWVYFTLVFIAWSLLLWRAYRRANQPSGVLLLGMNISNAVYVFSLLVLFVCAMGSVVSYARYLSTITQAMMTLLAMLSLNLFIAHPVSERCKACFGILGLVIVLSFCFGFSHVRFDPSYDDSENAVNSGMHHVGQITEQMPDVDGDEPVDLFLVQATEPGKNHHQIYFRLMDHNVRVKNYYMQSTPENDYADGQQWLDALLTEEYDFVYLESHSATFSQMMGELFAGEEPEDYRLYTVTPDGLVKTIPEFTPVPYQVHP